MRRIVRWWLQSDHFDWLSGYLHARDLTRPTQTMMVIVSLGLTLIPVNELWGPPAINQGVAITFGALAGLAGLGFAALWQTRWPTRRQSIAFAMTVSACIGFGCLIQANPLIAVMACTAPALAGGYLAFFHTAQFMFTNFMVAVVAGGVAATRLAASGEVLLAVSAYILVVGLNLAVPLAIQIVVHALGIDLLESDRDPLTGLLNRRAIEHAVVGMLISRRDADSCLAAAMIDLDQFKAINDTKGHAVGDATLRAVGEALRDNCGRAAVIGRIGGEEFIVADIATAANARAMGERLRVAIASAPLPVTASIGTAIVALCGVDSADFTELYNQLVAEADTAMYTAKRAGGNQVHHRGLTAYHRRPTR
jgi:diguanylate cyclase (GGDEF)-like protein